MPQALAKILVLAGLAFGAVWLNRRLKADEADPPSLTNETVLRVNAAHRVRLRRVAQLAGWTALALWLVGAGIMWIAPAPGVVRQDASRPGDSPPGPGPTPVPSPPPGAGGGTIDVPGSGTITLPRILLPAGLVLIAAGAVLMVRTKAQAAAGALLTAGTLSLAGSLFGDIKIDSLLKLDKGALQLEFTRGGGAGGFGLQHVTEFQGFALGSPELSSLGDPPADVEARFKKIEDLWMGKRREGKTGLLILVGSTDRVALRAGARTRFEANVGLAQARADAVRQRLLQRTSVLADRNLQIAREQILVLVSGPGNTPDRQLVPIGSTREAGFPDDRRVDVWAMWGSESVSGK